MSQTSGVRIWLLVVVIGVLASASAYAQSIDAAKVERVKVKIKEESDRFTGSTAITAKSMLMLEKTGLLTTLRLNPAIVVGDRGEATFYARGEYSGYGWAFLNGTAQFVIDGRRYSAQGSAEQADRKVETCGAGAGCLVSEVIRFPLTEELATAIANAGDAEVRFVGKNGSVDGRLNEKHVAYFREMLSRFKERGGVLPHEADTPQHENAASDIPAIAPAQRSQQESAECKACQRLIKP